MGKYFMVESSVIFHISYEISNMKYGFNVGDSSHLRRRYTAKFLAERSVQYFPSATSYFVGLPRFAPPIWTQCATHSIRVASGMVGYPSSP